MANIYDGSLTLNLAITAAREATYIARTTQDPGWHTIAAYRWRWVRDLCHWSDKQHRIATCWAYLHNCRANYINQHRDRL